MDGVVLVWLMVLVVPALITRSVQSMDVSKEKFRRNFALCRARSGREATRQPTCKKTSLSFRAPA
ncbi:MAG: hypothetical protein ACJ71T_08895 [Actinomycetales bacterium]